MNKILYSLILLVMMSPLAYAAKPGSALSIDMQWISPPVKGQNNEFKVIVTSGVAAEDMKLEITLPLLVQLTDGKASSVMKVESGKPLEILFRAFLPETSSGSIGAMISIGQHGQAYFSAIHELPIDDSQSTNLKARNSSQPPYEINERDGVRIREYKLPD